MRIVHGRVRYICGWMPRRNGYSPGPGALRGSRRRRTAASGCPDIVVGGPAANGGCWRDVRHRPPEGVRRSPRSIRIPDYFVSSPDTVIGAVPRHGIVGTSGEHSGGDGLSPSRSSAIPWRSRRTSRSPHRASWGSSRATCRSSPAFPTTSWARDPRTSSAHRRLHRWLRPRVHTHGRARAAGTPLQTHRHLLNQVGGGLLIAMGMLPAAAAAGWLQGEHRLHVTRRPTTLAGSALVGSAFAAGWRPRIGPSLGLIPGHVARLHRRPSARRCCSPYSLGIGSCPAGRASLHVGTVRLPVDLTSLGRGQPDGRGAHGSWSAS